MRRKDREVTDLRSITEIIDECDILRLGLADGDFPYIVPVNFAFRFKGNRLELYLHGASAGRKYELMKRNPFCSFEMDVPLKLECLSDERSVTMRYKSVMGTAEIRFLEDDEKQAAMDEIFMQRYGETRGFDYDKSALKRTAVACLTVLDITAKANLSSR